MRNIFSWIFDSFVDIVWVIIMLAVVFGNAWLITCIPWISDNLFLQVIIWAATTPILLYIVFIIGFMILCYIFDRDI